MSLIEIDHVCKKFGEQQVLHNLSLTLEENKQYSLVGASGSGKSTLLYLLGALDKPDSGKILVRGEDITQLTDSNLSLYRNREIGFIFQNHFLLSTMNCLDNILLPARIGGQDIGEVQSRSLKLAKEIGVEHCLSKYSYEISGGEAQRINIIRALSLKPKILLCDEPTGNIDSKNTQLVVSLLSELASYFKATMILVTHDARVASHFENKIKMLDGAIG